MNGKKSHLAQQKEALNDEDSYKDSFILHNNLMINTSHAGLFGNTAHSRANCLTFNESVTWNAKESHWWRVKSLHTSAKGAQHMVDTFMAYTWRAAAFHSGESNRDLHDPWTAQGYHFYMGDNGKEIYDAYTISTDCSAYDGWWG